MKDKLYKDVIRLVRLIRGNNHIHTGDIITTRLVGHVLNLNQDDTILDIGSGVGETISYLCDTYSCKACCFEIDINNYDELKKRNNNRMVPFELYNSNYLNTELQPTFSVVLLLASACHNESKIDLFAKCYVDCVANGRMYFEDYVALTKPSESDLAYLKNTLGVYGMPFGTDYEAHIRAGKWNVQSTQNISDKYRKYWSLFLMKYRMYQDDLEYMFGSEKIAEFEEMLMPFINMILSEKVGGVRIIAYK